MSKQKKEECGIKLMRDKKPLNFLHLDVSDRGKEIANISIWSFSGH